MFLCTGAMAVKAPRKVSEACGVNRGYNIPTLCQTLGLSLALLLCICISSWADCESGNFSPQDREGPVCLSENTYCSPSYSCHVGLDYTSACCSNFSPSTDCPQVARGYKEGTYVANPISISGWDRCFNGPTECRYSVRCTTQAEADSVANGLNKKIPSQFALMIGAVIP